jgi:hypothetical protein
MRLRVLGIFAGILAASSSPILASYVDIMPESQIAQYKQLLPVIVDSDVDALVQDPDTMWYDDNSMIPGYQDSAFDPMGFRPNTIDPGLINLAVPGGWNKLFQKSGRFGFPFGTGGADLSNNVVNIKFWSAPKDSAGAMLPVVYWKMGTGANFRRWRWLFPVGTSIGEVLMVKFPDGDLRISEIRVRTRSAQGWTNRVYRPFLTSQDLAEAVKSLRPNWESSSSLSRLVQYLQDPTTLSSRTLTSPHFAAAWQSVSGVLDYLPDFGDADLVKQLLFQTVFKPVGNTVWKSNGGKSAYAASTKESYSIVPKLYDGGMLPVNDQSCNRCHDSAGRQFNDFYPQLAAYGDFWGEDQIFSWHPFETSAFVDGSGNVVNFNNDNRRLRQDFVNAGLVVKYNPSVHSQVTYKEIPHSWTWDQF